MRFLGCFGENSRAVLCFSLSLSRYGDPPRFASIVIEIVVSIRKILF